MASDIDREGVAKAYERWAPVYDLVFGKVFDHGRQSTIAEADRIGGRILDVGVGTGLSLSDYSRNVKLCGVDISEPMLRKAQSRVRALGLANVETLAVMDAKNLAFADSSFDAVVAQYVITAVPDPEATLDDFIRVLKPGGELILVNHIGAESGPRRAFELAFAPLARRLGWRPEFPWARLVAWEKQAWRRRTRRAAVDAADGTFFADPLPQILKSSGNHRARKSFSLHADETFLVALGCVAGALRRFACASPIVTDNASGADRAACARGVDRMRTAAAARNRRAAGLDHRPGDRAARRQAGKVERRVVPAFRRRSGNARADAGCRQYAGDPAARQPRRQPECPAEISRIWQRLDLAKT